MSWKKCATPAACEILGAEREVQESHQLGPGGGGTYLIFDTSRRNAGIERCSAG